MKYGVAYFPEHRSREEIREDVRLMREAGMTVARLAEFTWCLMEPEEGSFDFTWLEEVVGLLAENGISTILCTPTACPPAWMFSKYPEIAYMDNRGIRRPFGGRRHYCYNSEVYRAFCSRIAEALAKHFASHSQVIGYQIDNELAQEATGRCHCEACTAKFRSWLESKYGTINRLNERLGTRFWGSTFDGFSQIPLPVTPIEPGAERLIGPFYDHPSIRLEFERFCSDSMIEFAQLQIDAIHEHSKVPVTTNGTSHHTHGIDYYKLFGQMDRYALDTYPDMRGDEMPNASFTFALARGMKDKPFWVLEMGCGGGHGLWVPGMLQSYPGAVEQAAVHAFVSGAEVLTHFPFNTFSYGAEQLDAALIANDGVPSRQYGEVKSAATSLKKLGAMLESSEIVNDAAVCFDFDSLWSLKIKPPHKDFNYGAFCQSLYDGLRNIGVQPDLISYDERIFRYKCVIVPAPFVMNDTFKSLLRRYVDQGGVVLTTFLAAVKNEDNVASRQILPCGLDDVFGIRVAEVDPVYAGTEAFVKLELDGTSAVGPNRYWTEALEPRGAEVIGRYADSFRSGQPVVTRHRHGQGIAFYMGTALEREALQALLASFATEAGVQAGPWKSTAKLEIVKRKRNGKDIYCAFNFQTVPASVPLPGSFMDLITGERLSGSAMLEAKSYGIWEEADDQTA